MLVYEIWVYKLGIVQEKTGRRNWKLIHWVELGRVQEKIWATNVSFFEKMTSLEISALYTGEQFGRQNRRNFVKLSWAECRRKFGRQKRVCRPNFLLHSAHETIWAQTGRATTSPYCKQILDFVKEFLMPIVAQIVLLYIARLFRDLSFFRKMTLFHGLEAGDPNTPPFFRSCEISVKRNMGIRFSPEHSSHMNDRTMQ